MDTKHTETKTDRFDRIIILTAVLALAAMPLAVPARGSLPAADAAQAAESAVMAVKQTQWPPDSPELVNEYEGIIRFHVIANSDTDEDQALKLQVRNIVIMKLQNALGSSVDIEETRQFIEDNIELIEEWAQDCVNNLGYDYSVSARIGVSAIPAKEYDNLYFPAGNYEALTLTIGEGKGQNWWCVVFPPLCLVDASDEAYGELFCSDGQGGLVLRSKLLEILDRYGKNKNDC